MATNSVVSVTVTDVTKCFANFTGWVQIAASNVSQKYSTLVFTAGPPNTLTATVFASVVNTVNGLAYECVEFS